MREISTKKIEIGEHVMIDGDEFVAEIGSCGVCEYHNYSNCDYSAFCPVGGKLTKVEKQPTYRPYKDTEEMVADFKKRFNAKVPPYAMPMIWVRNKTFKDCRLITVFRDKVVMIIVSGEDMKELFKDYTYLDGSPCGIKEE